MAGEIRVSEIFESVQGEGPKTGEPTTFLRLAGCNFQCAGWGVKTTLPDGTEVTGCDSPHSVFPQIYRQEGQSKLMTWQEIVESIPEYPRNVCLTGGEPLLQWKRIEPAIRLLLHRGQSVEIFTNGSFVMPGHYGFGTSEDAVWLSPTYVMDFKPPSSGEFGKFKELNFDYLRREDAVKFVIGDKNDYEVAKSVVERYKNHTFVQWYFGVVFGKLDPRELIGWILEDKLNVKLNLQTQSLMGMDESERTAYGKIV